MIDLTAAQRQSPLAIVFLGLRIFRSLGIAQIVILALFIVRAPFDGFLSVLPFLIVVAFGGFSALAWWHYTFQLVDGELVVTKGVVRVVRLNVPIERIQSVAIEQRLLHRLTGLVQRHRRHRRQRRSGVLDRRDCPARGRGAATSSRDGGSRSDAERRQAATTGAC